MARIDELFNFLQTPGLSDQQIAAEINRLGVTAQEVSQLTGVPLADVQSRISRPLASDNFNAFESYLRSTPGLTDAQIAAEAGRLGVNAQQISTLTGVPVDQVQSRMTVKTPNVVNTSTNQQDFAKYLQTPGLTDAQILAEMQRLGINSNQVAGTTGMPVNQVENRVSNLLPFSNATQGFEQNFRNYTSIPIGAQYNPNVTGGVSPYGQIMSQMQPVGNPYATARSGLAMGGYDPTIYDPKLLSNFVKQRANELAAQNTSGGVVDVSGGGDAGGGSGASGGTTGVGGGMSNSGEGGADAGWYNGGLIDRVTGNNPSTPDDGQINAQVGEYVVKKSSVNKYGKGLLDMINAGKIPAKKIKSLLD